VLGALRVIQGAIFTFGALGAAAGPLGLGIDGFSNWFSKD